MSGIKKTQSLGHCPIRSTDLRRSPGLLSLSGPRSVSLSISLCLSQPSHASHRLRDCIHIISVGWGWGWGQGWTSTLTLTWTWT